MKMAAVGIRAAVGKGSFFLPKWTVVWVGIEETAETYIKKEQIAGAVRALQYVHLLIVRCTVEVN